MLDTLPDNFEAICSIARHQIVHYRMLSQWEIPRLEWKTLPRSGEYLFSVSEILSALKRTPPGTLSKDRPVMNRLRGSCSNESIFLTALLRYRGIPARVRVGYFRNLYQGSRTLQFWMNVNQYEREGRDPEGMKQFVREAIKNKNLIEHWICEYWDQLQQRWRLLDVKTEYPESYGIEVDKHLDEAYFEYAWESWLKMKEPDFNHLQYSGDTWDGDGRSHIRQQLLLDYYSLLNHEAAVIGSEAARSFVKKSFSAINKKEMQELEQLADLMSQDPTVSRLVEFYQTSETIKLRSLEENPYSFVNQESLLTTH